MTKYIRIAQVLIVLAAAVPMAGCTFFQNPPRHGGYSG